MNGEWVGMCIGPSCAGSEKLKGQDAEIAKYLIVDSSVNSLASEISHKILATAQYATCIIDALYFESKVDSYIMSVRVFACVAICRSLLSSGKLVHLSQKICHILAHVTCVEGVQYGNSNRTAVRKYGFYLYCTTTIGTSRAGLMKL